MGSWFHGNASAVVWRGRFKALTRVESRSPLPAFKNLGRGVF
jgi:hypothetical protein